MHPVATKRELLLEQMNLKLARAVLSLEAAFLATKPTLTAEAKEELENLRVKIDEFLDLLEKTNELDTVG